MDFFTQDYFSQDWFVSGLLLMVFVPLVVIVINELIYVVKRRKLVLVKPLQNLKNVILPLIALVLVCIHILEFPRNTNAIKILETFIWIFIINVFLSIINGLFLSGDGMSSQAKMPQLFLDIFRVVLVLFGAAIVLSAVWGADLGDLVTALGLGSFVIGLALQDTLGNLFSGIALVYEKPFSEGDYIEVEGQVGRVIEVNWRAIRLLTREQELIVIPHLVIGQGSIKNYSRPVKIHILKTNLEFSINNPPNLVKEAILKTCYSTPGILHEPEPEVKTNEYSDFKTIYEVEFAIDKYQDHEEIMDDFVSRVWYGAKRNGLEFPMGHMMLHREENVQEKERSDIDQLEVSLEKLPQMLPIEKTNVKELMDGSAIRYFGKGEQILRQGSPTGQLFVILEGRASLQTTTEDGRVITIGYLEKGDFFGEVTMFTSKFSSFTVTALADIKLISIFQNEVMEMVELNPRLAVYLDEMMDARRLKLKELEKV